MPSWRGTTKEQVESASPCPAYSEEGKSLLRHIINQHADFRPFWYVLWSFPVAGVGGRAGAVLRAEFLVLAFGAMQARRLRLFPSYAYIIAVGSARDGDRGGR